MSTPLPPWTTRDSFRRDPHQRHITRTNELSNLTPPASGEVLRTPFGTGIVKPDLRPFYTDYLVYITAVGTGSDLPTHSGGIYDGYCTRLVHVFNTIDTLRDTFCRIYVDDERWSNAFGTPGVDCYSHWVKAGTYGIGHFAGDYTSETTPRPIIHATGFAADPNDHGVTVPFATGQKWDRTAPYIDPTAGGNATAAIGDVAPSVSLKMNTGNTRRFYFDASGRLRYIDQEGT